MVEPVTLYRSPVSPSAAANWDAAVPFDSNVKCNGCVSAIWARDLTVAPKQCECNKQLEPESKSQMFPHLYENIKSSLMRNFEMKDRGIMHSYNKPTCCREPLLSKHLLKKECKCYRTGCMCRLPVEIIQKIFSYFTQTELCNTVAPVCHHWLMHAYNSVHWKKMHFSQGMLCSKVLDICTQRGSLLQELKLAKCKLFSSDLFGLLLQSCPLIEQLHLGDGPQIEHECVSLISLNLCDTLTELDLSHQYAIDHQCVQLMRPLKKLQRLNLAHCFQIRDDSIADLAFHLTQLQHLNIDGLDFVTDHGILMLAQLRYSTLLSLSLYGAGLTDLAIAAVSLCKFLEHFSISLADKLTDNALGYLKRNTCLRELCIRKGYSLEESYLLAFFQSPCHLTYLNLTSCINLTDNVVHAICQSCGPSLKVLIICLCRYVTDYGLQAILNSCSQLETLQLQGLRISDCLLTKIATKLPYLKTLNLSDEIDDKMVATIMSMKPPDLEVNYLTFF